MIISSTLHKDNCYSDFYMHSFELSIIYSIFFLIFTCTVISINSFLFCILFQCINYHILFILNLKDIQVFFSFLFLSCQSREFWTFIHRMFQIPSVFSSTLSDCNSKRDLQSELLCLGWFFHKRKWESIDIQLPKYYYWKSLLAFQCQNFVKIKYPCRFGSVFGFLIVFHWLIY